ncbi:MAG: NADP-dependent oxidoreductase [Candidatus Spyradocola sp.]|jgi:NADPH:quinone reductase-like Zn-dependent oxidoreductase
MQAIQIDRYSKEIHVVLREIPCPEIGPNEVLLRVKAAAVNPLDILILTGSVKWIQNYAMPLTLGNECSGVVEKVGANVTGFRAGDAAYARLPLGKIGAFAEFVAIPASALAKMPSGYDFPTAAALPLAGLTAWQGITEELAAKPGETVLIPGGSGSFGQVAVPIAKALGLRVIVTGNARAQESLQSAGADRYLDYRRENYWEVLSGVDHVIDTLGAAEFEHELSVLKKGGRLLSLRTGPNRAFAERNGYPPLHRMLFTIAGAKYDRAAKRQGKEYRFLFVRADGAQLEQLTQIFAQKRIVPKTDPRTFSLAQAQEALALVARGHTDGKVLLLVGD